MSDNVAVNFPNVEFVARAISAAHEAHHFAKILRSLETLQDEVLVDEQYASARSARSKR